MQRPKNAIIILLDSLNRHMLGCYGGSEFRTPQIDRFAARATRFDRHYTGSLPCMPARHDLLCGSLDFLWKCWGSVEIWEDNLSAVLCKAGIATQLISDHPHLFEIGGENYHCDFEAWSYERGHETDAWKLKDDPSWAGTPHFGRGNMPYDKSRRHFLSEADFPGPRTMSAAADWLREHADLDRPFFLFVDEFDPHEPFDTPAPWENMYSPDWSGERLVWPPYMQGAIAKGIITASQGEQLRRAYGSKLSMIDHWFGKILDALDEAQLWDNTLVILCTDHGHYLGEKDIWGKPGVPTYNPISHIPLMISYPGVAASSISTLTTNVDIFATIADLFEVSLRQKTHGYSLLPLLEGNAKSIRTELLTGVWGREICLVTEDFKFVKAPPGDNAPLSMLSNRWSTMPTHVLDKDVALPLPDHRAFLDRMPGSNVPVIHQVFEADDPKPFWAWTKFSGDHLYDTRSDPSEDNNLLASGQSTEWNNRLARVLDQLEVPLSQFERLGLRKPLLLP